MPRATTHEAILAEIDRASFETYEPQVSERMRTARTVLLAMPEGAQRHYTGMMSVLMGNVKGRGFGSVTAFEVLVALGHLLERDAPDA